MYQAQMIPTEISIPISGGSRGAPGARPPVDQNFFNFIGFSENIIKILGRFPSPRDWHPLLGEVLDPLLPIELFLIIGTRGK